MQALIIAAIGVVIIYKLHFWVERTFKIDDAVGAVAVHGYAGFYGVVIAGFVLWGTPSSAFEGYAAINPLGQLVGAVIMFGVLGFLPAWVLCAIFKAAGVLRIPREIELVGLDIAIYHGRYLDEDEVRRAEVRAPRPLASFARLHRGSERDSPTRSRVGRSIWPTIGPIYPWVGSEGLLVVLGVAVLDRLAHLADLWFESRTYEEELRRLNTPEKIERAMREQRLD